MSKRFLRRPGAGLVLVGCVAVAGVAGAGMAACASDGETQSPGTGGNGPLASYTPEGCGYAVTLPDGVEAAMGDAAGSGPPDHVHVSFVGPTASSFVVNWRSDAATTATQILYGTDQAAVEGAQAPAAGVSRQTGHTASYTGLLGGPTRVHETHVCGLSAATRYFYKVGGPGAWSPVFEVSTGPAIGSTAAYKIAVLGDSRDDPSVFATLQEMLFAQGADLELFTGDGVQVGSNQLDWNSWFEANGPNGSVAPILAGVPIMMSNGNHDALAVNYLMQFAMPQELSAGETGAGEEWYSFDYANAHVVVLNDTTATSAAITAQRDFLEADLAGVDRAKTPWVFAMHHRALYSCSNHGSDVDLRSVWQPIYDQFQVDLVLNGHDHDYERSHPIRGFQPGSSDGALAASGADDAPVNSSGTVYVVAGGAGAPLYGSAACYHTQLSESVRNYVLLEIADHTLTYRAYRLDGTLLDSFDYTK